MQGFDKIPSVVLEEMRYTFVDRPEPFSGGHKKTTSGTSQTS